MQSSVLVISIISLGIVTHYNGVKALQITGNPTVSQEILGWNKKPRVHIAGPLWKKIASWFPSENASNLVAFPCPRWRHQIETFSAFHLCGQFTSEFPAQRPMTRSFDVFFDLRLNKRLSKQSWGLWFETPSRRIRRHCNELPKQICGLVTSYGD